MPKGPDLRNNVHIHSLVVFVVILGAALVALEASSPSYASNPQTQLAAAAIPCGQGDPKINSQCLKESQSATYSCDARQHKTKPDDPKKGAKCMKYFDCSGSVSGHKIEGYCGNALCCHVTKVDGKAPTGLPETPVGSGGPKTTPTPPPLPNDESSGSGAPPTPPIPSSGEKPPPSGGTPTKETPPSRPPVNGEDGLQNPLKNPDLEGPKIPPPDGSKPNNDAASDPCSVVPCSEALPPDVQSGGGVQPVKNSDVWNNPVALMPNGLPDQSNGSQPEQELSTFGTAQSYMNSPVLQSGDTPNWIGSPPNEVNPSESQPTLNDNQGILGVIEQGAADAADALTRAYNSVAEGFSSVLSELQNTLGIGPANEPADEVPVSPATEGTMPPDLQNPDVPDQISPPVAAPQPEAEKRFQEEDPDFQKWLEKNPDASDSTKEFMKQNMRNIMGDAKNAWGKAPQFPDEPILNEKTGKYEVWTGMGGQNYMPINPFEQGSKDAGPLLQSPRSWGVGYGDQTVIDDQGNVVGPRDYAQQRYPMPTFSDVPSSQELPPEYRPQEYLIPGPNGELMTLPKELFSPPSLPSGEPSNSGDFVSGTNPQIQLQQYSPGNTTDFSVSNPNPVANQVPNPLVSGQDSSAPAAPTSPGAANDLGPRCGTCSLTFSNWTSQSVSGIDAFGPQSNVSSHGPFDAPWELPAQSGQPNDAFFANAEGNLPLNTYTTNGPGTPPGYVTDVQNFPPAGGTMPPDLQNPADPLPDYPDYQYDVPRDQISPPPVAAPQQQFPGQSFNEWETLRSNNNNKGTSVPLLSGNPYVGSGSVIDEGSPNNSIIAPSIEAPVFKMPEYPVPPLWDNVFKGFEGNPVPGPLPSEYEPWAQNGPGLEVHLFPPYEAPSLLSPGSLTNPIDLYGGLLQGDTLLINNQPLSDQPSLLEPAQETPNAVIRSEPFTQNTAPAETMTGSQLVLSPELSPVQSPSSQPDVVNPASPNESTNSQTPQSTWMDQLDKDIGQTMVKAVNDMSRAGTGEPLITSQLPEGASLKETEYFIEIYRSLGGNLTSRVWPSDTQVAFAGETHGVLDSRPAGTELMLEGNASHLVLEAFQSGDQPLLDQWQRGEVPTSQVKDRLTQHGWDNTGGDGTVASYMQMLEAAKTAGVTVRAADLDNPGFDNVPDRNKQWASVVQNILTDNPDARVLVYGGMAHMGYGPSGESVNQLLSNQGISSTVVDIMGGRVTDPQLAQPLILSPSYTMEPGLDAKIGQAAVNTGLDQTRFLVPMAPSSRGTYQADYILHLPQVQLRR